MILSTKPIKNLCHDCNKQNVDYERWEFMQGPDVTVCSECGGSHVEIFEYNTDLEMLHDWTLVD